MNNPTPRFGPPGYPLRPINGGPLPKALPKYGRWIMEGKYNGWRAWVHVPTRTMFNRQNGSLSITHEFGSALEILSRLGSSFEWLDVEALERRHQIGRGTLIVLDAPMTGGSSRPAAASYYGRLFYLHMACAVNKIPVHKELNVPIADNSVYLPMSWRYDAAAGSPIQLWDILQKSNAALGCEFWEGIVVKRDDSTYPLQLRSPDTEFPFWVKHRWHF